MATRTLNRILAFVLLPVLAGCGRAEAPAVKDISGRIEQGLRVLTIAPGEQGQVFRVYRGDYVQPQLANGAAFRLEIPDLDMFRSFPAPEGETPYFKMAEAGVYAFTAGDAAGTIEAVEFQAASFRDVSAAEGAAFIAKREPLVLDVRTRREFDGGRLENAVLLPIQELQGRIDELSQYKDRPIFIYCRSGNRSTVAAKLLIDAGHREIVNLRRGIVDWERQGFPIVR